MTATEEKKAAPAMEPFMTPVVKDEEGRRLTRTMRRTDKLEDLMHFYYAMLPSRPNGDCDEGVFLCHGRRVKGDQTPADHGIQDGDEIEFFPAIKPSMLVTPVLRDKEGRRLARTMRRTDGMQSLMDFYYTMVPAVKYGSGSFVAQLCGTRATGKQTPADLDLEDGDQIDFTPE